MLINVNHNKNESKEHYELKQISKYILYNKGYNCIANEVQFSRYSDLLRDYKWFNKKAISKSIIDTIGIKGNMINVRNKELDSYKTMGIEAKASYGDFINGFCCQSIYTYIIAPKLVIPVDKIPNKIGLIEVDLENYKISIERGKFEFKGIEIVKQCRSRKEDIYKRKDVFRCDMHNILKKIAYRSSIENIYKHNEIVVSGCKNRI